MKTISFFFSALFFLHIAVAQECYPVDKTQIPTIQQDVEFLADDALTGRYPGTYGALRAKNYIAERFMSFGLQPKGTSGFDQMFTVPEPVKIAGEGNFVTIKGEALKQNEQYYPTQYSANGKVEGKTVWVKYGITAPELNYDDLKSVKNLEGKIAVMDVSSPDGIHPHSEYAKYHDLGGRIGNLKKMGAIGVMLVNLGDMAEDVRTGYKKIRSTEVPVVFVSDDAYAKKIKKSVEVSFGVNQMEQTAEAFNVVGFLDNKRPTTVVIGAHYDHLGYGGSGTGSLYTGEPAIHNGADDNASGTAALIAMAEYLSKSTDLKGHNYLFIAFTAEEMGLLGSNYFANNPTYPIEQMCYMVNMDMVGRLREGKLQISGTGTAEQWDGVFAKLGCDNFDFKLDESGVGPSDHTSFYNVDLPVLHFFTGTHEDYHKPADDADKINYQGIAEVISVIKTVMTRVDNEEKLEFRETKNQDARKAPRFSVTLGIMPDYMYEDGGVRIDGVTEGKPAAEAGLQKGDIITKLGDFNIVDMYAYMNALAAFKKGDKAVIVYLREGNEMEGKVQF